MIGLLLAAVVAGLVAGRAVGLRLRRSATPLPPSTPTGADRAAKDDPRLAGFPCTLGDVLLVGEGADAWLTGAVLFLERSGAAGVVEGADRAVAALFHAADAVSPAFIYARPAPSPSIDWLSESLDQGAAFVSAEDPPMSFELGEELFARVRRLPVALASIGAGTPDLGPTAILGEYEAGSGATALVVVAPKGARVFRGRRLELGMFDILSAGAKNAQLG